MSSTPTGPQPGLGLDRDSPMHLKPVNPPVQGNLGFVNPSFLGHEFKCS